MFHLPVNIRVQFTVKQVNHSYGTVGTICSILPMAQEKQFQLVIWYCASKAGSIIIICSEQSSHDAVGSNDSHVKTVKKYFSCLINRSGV